MTITLIAITTLLALLVVILTAYAMRGSGVELIREDRTEDGLEDLWRLPAADRDGAE